MMKSGVAPTIGRVVWFYPADDIGRLGEGPLAAIITHVAPYARDVDLTIFAPGEVEFRERVPYSIGPAPGSWSWPRLIEPK
jgi:hypothetical protein